MDTDTRTLQFETDRLAADMALSPELKSIGGNVRIVRTKLMEASAELGISPSHGLERLLEAKEWMNNLPVEAYGIYRTRLINLINDALVISGDIPEESASLAA